MLKLGIIGLSPGNGHPYSWSAIFNGYDPPKMAKCPFSVIPEYLSVIGPDNMGIEGAKITHIWTQDREISEDVAGAAKIENIVDNMTDLIGAVDAVILARDDGENHLRMAAPFIDAGIPLFIDKPLTDNLNDLRQFIAYYEAGKPIMSCSSMRYVEAVCQAKEELGEVLTAHAITGKYWRTYGIHIIEAVYAVMGGGVKSVQNVGEDGQEIVHLRWHDGRHAVLQSFKDIHYALHLGFYGTQASRVITETDAYSSFRAMLVDFVQMLRTGTCPIDWHQTVEMIKIVVAGQLSLQNDHVVVEIADIT